MERNLNSEELKCLKSVFKNRIDYKDDKNKDLLMRLCSLELITYLADDEGRLQFQTSTLTPSGLSYLEESLNKRKAFFMREIRGWISLFLSICAIIVSIIALVHK